MSSEAMGPCCCNVGILIDDWDDELFLLSRFWLYSESKETFATVILTMLVR